MRKYLQAIGRFIVDQWFIVGMAVLIAISSQVQVPDSQQHLRQTIVTYLCVSIIFFFTGCTLPTRVLLENYSKWKVHAFVQAQCFLLTSATVFAVVSAVATSHFLDPGIIIGFIFLGSLPTTLSSNVVMTGQAHGNTALTVVQVTIGNFLGPLISPLLITMYTSTGAWYDSFLPDSRGGFGGVYRRVFKQLGLSVYLPMVAGQIVQNVFPRITKKVLIEKKFIKVNSFALLIIIWQTFDQAFATGAFTSVPPSNIIFMVFISIVFYFIWLSISFFASLPWLPKKDIIAVCYCVPAKTPAIGVPLSNVMYVGLTTLQGSKIQIPMVIFQGLQILAGSLFTIVYRRWVRPDEEREEAERKKEHEGHVPQEGEAC